MNKTLFLSGSEPEIINKLNTMGYNIIISEPNKALDVPIRSHTDCLLFKPDKNTYFIEEGNYHNLVNILTKDEEQNLFKEKNITKVSVIKSPYPDDVKLNAKVFGKKILCNTNTVSDYIKAYALKNNYKLIHCNQGYAACSTVKLTDNAAITDDLSVYNTLSSIEIDCLMVSKGSVKLKGYSYGFIGGCCGMIENNLIAFTGNIDKHADSELIKNFFMKHCIDYINLSDGELIDIGGIIRL